MDDEVMRRLDRRVDVSDDTPRLIAERLQSYWNCKRGRCWTITPARGYWKVSMARVGPTKCIRTD